MAPERVDRAVAWIGAREARSARFRAACSRFHDRRWTLSEPRSKFVLALALKK